LSPATANTDIPDCLDADELHDAGPIRSEGTDRERPEGIVIEAGHTAKLRGERARIFRRDDTDETVSAYRPDPKCRSAVVGGESPAHYKTRTDEGRIGLASGRHVDGAFGCDLHTPGQSQNESEDTTHSQWAPGSLRGFSTYDLQRDGHETSDEGMGRARTLIEIDLEKLIAGE
jgi:hypothetical protein